MVTVKTNAVEVSDEEKLVDADIAAFGAWAQEALKFEPLVRSEKAVLKLYLRWKLRVQK